MSIRSMYLPAHFSFRIWAQEYDLRLYKWSNNLLPDDNNSILAVQFQQNELLKSVFIHAR